MKPQTEAQFMGAVIDLARSLGWKCAHFRSVRVQRKDGNSYYATPVAADGSGFPDLILAKPGCPIYFLELKVGKGKVSPAQEEWLGLLNRAGSPALVVRPEDFDKLVRILER